MAVPEDNAGAGSDSDLEDLIVELGLDLNIEEGETGASGKSAGNPSRAQSRHQKPESRVLNAAEKIHEIITYVTISPKRRKEMRQIIAQTCQSDTRHLFVKKSMRIRWGSVRAELKRAIELRAAVTHFVATLDSRQPQGKLREKARRLQERWTLKSEEWDLLATLVEALDPFQTATEAMSRRDAPTLTEVIPTFALLEHKLLNKITMLKAKGRDSATSRALLSGLEAGLVKLRKYQALAHQSDLCLIATVLNPRLRLKYLERWTELHSHARTILTYIFESYRVQFANPTDFSTSPTTASDPFLKSTSHWENEIYSDVPLFAEEFDRELQEYFNGNYPCPREMDTLGWWKTHSPHMSTVSRIARDFLCIPAASVSVERLFSQCKLTMTDIRSSMSFETARRRICCQHWLKAGVDADVVREALGID